MTQLPREVYNTRLLNDIGSLIITEGGMGDIFIDIKMETPSSITQDMELLITRSATDDFCKEANKVIEMATVGSFEADVRREGIYLELTPEEDHVEVGDVIYEDDEEDDGDVEPPFKDTFINYTHKDKMFDVHLLYHDDVAGVEAMNHIRFDIKGFIEFVTKLHSIISGDTVVDLTRVVNGELPF